MHVMNEYLMITHEPDWVRRINETRKQYRARILADQGPALEAHRVPSTNPKETARCH